EIIGYLLNRKLSQESIDKFEIGFALDSWDSFLKYAIAKNISEQELVNAGLIRKNDNNRTYDYFRNRIMFPIKDYLGRVVGFSGRVIDESLPKYLNTNETSIFKKAELLYGLDTAKHAIRETKTAIVVEGFMDAIALQQTGFDNAVAALGANLSMQQAIALKRLDVNLVYLAFDADEAGQRAILSGLDQKIGNEFLIKAVSVPYGKDPADAVLEGSIEEFRKALENGLSEVEFRFKTVFGKYDNKTTEGKQKILNELLVSLQPKDVFDPVAAEMRRLVIDYLEIDGNRLDKFLNSKKQRKLNQTQIKGLETTKKSSQIAIFELEIMALVMLEPEQLEDNINTIQSSLPNEELSILSEFINICQISNYDDHAILEEYQNRDEGKILFERLFSQPNTEEYKIDVAKHLDNLLSSLRELYLNAEKEDVRAKLLARMAEVSQQLSSPELAAEELQSYYQELKLIQQMLAARDAERRLRHSPRQKN
ncbi:MAG TPA: toprim domain-containing protein, partial [Trueperaceae bacterium]|nr:toprim domain-containing protein [Trueperaceae bacterium]